MKITRNIIILCIIFIFSGCFGTPTSDIVEWGVQDYISDASVDFTGMGHYLPNLSQYGYKNELISFEVINKYSRKIEGEKYFIYEFEANIKHYGGESIINGTIGLIRRGDSWYSIHIE